MRSAFYCYKSEIRNPKSEIQNQLSFPLYNILKKVILRRRRKGYYSQIK